MHGGGGFGLACEAKSESWRSLDGGSTWELMNHSRDLGGRTAYYNNGPSFRGPSNSRTGGFGGIGGPISRSEWVTVGAGESGFGTPDPEDPNIVWSSAPGSGARGGVVVMWAGSNHGLVHVTRDGGGTWSNVTGNIPVLPPDGVVRGIHAQRPVRRGQPALRRVDQLLAFTA